MPIDKKLYRDFLTAMGEEFGNLVSPPVPFFEANPHDCCEAIALVFGDAITPARLAEVSNADLGRIAGAFSQWFECDAPPTSQIAEAIARTLARWPVGSLDDKLVS
jgi:hypothetical protein